jgi:hypothetical protein
MRIERKKTVYFHKTIIIFSLTSTDLSKLETFCFAKKSLIKSHICSGFGPCSKFLQRCTLRCCTWLETTNTLVFWWSRIINFQATQCIIIGSYQTWAGKMRENFPQCLNPEDTISTSDAPRTPPPHTHTHTHRNPENSCCVDYFWFN